MRPFDREDAKKRAAGCRNHAETMRGSMKERQRIADEATNDDDRRAALSCLEICRREVEYLNGKARLKALHAMFATDRVIPTAEWFHMSRAVMAHVLQLTQRRGLR